MVNPAERVTPKYKAISIRIYAGPFRPFLWFLSLLRENCYGWIESSVGSSGES